LKDFIPLYTVRNAVIENSQDSLRIDFGKGGVFGVGRFTGINIQNHDFYAVLDYPVVDQQGKEVSIYDPDFDR
jgi:hypothetical protein